MDAQPPGKANATPSDAPDGPPGTPLDRSALLRLVSAYRMAVQGETEVTRARLLPGVDPEHPQVRAALAAWGGDAYVVEEPWGAEVLLVRPLPAPPPRWRLHAWLFALTLVTTLAAGALMQGVDPFATRFAAGGWLAYPTGFDARALLRGAGFALPFLAILLCHESGHYFAAKRYRVPVSPPYFLPMPPWLSLVGTMGAFIRLKGPMVRRPILFDVGAAGPFASFVLSLPAIALGLAWSEPVEGTASLASPFVVHFAGETVRLGAGGLLHALGALAFPEYGVRPVLLHPLAFAGWLGLFVTALNLMPLGQLDGGHILYSLWDQRRQERAARAFLAVLLPLGVLWWGWWIWGTAALLVNRGRLRHPPVLQPTVPLDPRRRALAWLAIAVFLATLPPVPLSL